MDRKNALLRGNPWAYVWRFIGLYFLYAEGTLLFLIYRIHAFHRVDNCPSDLFVAKSPRLLNRKESRNEQTFSPIEEARGDTVVLRSREPFDI